MCYEERSREQGEKEKEDGTGCSPEEELTHWVFCLEAFISLLQARILEEVSGEDFRRLFISSPGVSFQGYDFLWLVCGRAKGLSHYSWFWCHPPGLFWAWS